MRDRLWRHDRGGRDRRGGVHDEGVVDGGHRR
jgi:hypothetical protein